MDKATGYGLRDQVSIHGRTRMTLFVAMFAGCRGIT
jgi:hypothetical protein